MSDDLERDEDLDEIRAAYDRYERDGHAALWDKDNAGYRRLASERDAALDSLIRSSVNGRDDVRLLDVGCGTGQLAVRLHATQPEISVVGIDLLAQRIEVATTNAPWANFRVGSADDLPWEDGFFDIVTAITLFSSLPSTSLEASSALEIGRVLRPGGWLVWYDLRYPNPWNPSVHALPRKRLAELYPGWEMELRPLSVPPPFARRMGRLTPFAYPALHAVRPLRSHLVGRLERPV
jgi:SAM-dependent methyltransferase